jgi:hypothetical protein
MSAVILTRRPTIFLASPSTGRDGRSALVFRVNPLGALRDQQTVDVGSGRRSLTTHLLAVETRLAANPRLQFVTFVQWNTAARQVTGNARWRGSTDRSRSSTVYNHRGAISGIATATNPVESRQLLLRWTWLVQL